MVEIQKHASNYSFTSESVCSGHPDKICDQISDAIVDAVLAKDPMGRVAIETMVTEDNVFIAGEVTSKTKINYSQIAGEQIRRLGYTNPLYGFTDKSPVTVLVHEQSQDIAIGVEDHGAGDQGMMFGYACKETESLMPLPISIAHRLAQTIDESRENKLIPYLRPDGKTQVTVDYKNGKPVGISHVVIAVPHSESVKINEVKSDIYENVVSKVLDEFGYSCSMDTLIVNGTGVWNIGGPGSDTGVTGRKIVVDGYGGMARVGGGAFSGKDPTKVDRSAAYAARYLAKNIVANGYAERAEVRLAYVIGQRYPLMQDVETFGTAKVKDSVIFDFMSSLLDTSVKGIIDGLGLRAPLYLRTAAYGHFGRDGFPWERVL